MTVISGFFSAVFWGVVLLSSLVFVHEAGHFLSARAFGMRVTEFFLGMPCRFRLSRTSATRGTEYGVTPILLGGYTRICGMEEPDCPRLSDVLAYVAKEGRCTVSDLADGLSMPPADVDDCLYTLVDWAAIEPYWDERLGETRKETRWPSTFQTVRRDADLLTAFDRGHDFSKPGSTDAGQAHPLPEGGADALLAQERSHTYVGKGFVARFVTLFSGPLVNLVLGLALIVGSLMATGVTVANNVPTIGSVQDGSLAQAAGLQAGDAITAIDGEEVSTWVDMGSLLQGKLSEGNPVELSCDRAGSALTVSVGPIAEGAEAKIGIMPTTSQYHPDLLTATRGAWRYVTMTAEYVARLLQPAHTAEVVSQSSSVVGISVVASQAARSGPSDFVFLMAAVSLSLGLMNLLPIPPLDGGKILIELVQLVSRRRVPARVQNGLSYVGLALFLALFFVVLRQDVVRFVLGG